MKTTAIFFIALFMQALLITADTLPDQKTTPPSKTLVHAFTITKVTGLNEAVPKNFEMDDYVIVTLADSGNAHALDTLLFKYPKTLSIWLNGIYFPELKILNYNATANQLVFRLQCDTCKTNTFKIFYSYSARRMFNLRHVDLQLQLGTKDKTLTAGFPFAVQFKVLWMEVLGYICMLLLLATFILLVKNHGILRDYVMFDKSVDIIRKGVPGPNQVLLSEIPYSLARFQLSVWTLLTVCGVLYIWLNLDEMVGLNESIVMLLGISGGTSIVAKIIDKQQSDPTACITAAQFTSDMKSDGFFSDMLRDEKGISIHRFQLLVFTLGLGFYFIWHVIYSLEMPVFSTNQLLLMGVSSTTYAGIKYNEK